MGVGANGTAGVPNELDREYLLHLIKRTQITRYIALASATLIYYDYFLTFSKEGEWPFRGANSPFDLLLVGFDY